MKGLFIPEITAEMFRNGCLESIEALMAEGEIYDIDYPLEQQPSEDCISRQAVEEITWEEPSYTDALNVLTEVRDKIRQLPSVTPQPKVGEWLKNGELCRCSRCDSLVLRSVVKAYNYCFRCGAKMEVSE